MQKAVQCIMTCMYIPLHSLLWWLCRAVSSPVAQCVAAEPVPGNHHCRLESEALEGSKFLVKMHTVHGHPGQFFSLKAVLGVYLCLCCTCIHTDLRDGFLIVGKVIHCLFLWR